MLNENDILRAARHVIARYGEAYGYVVADWRSASLRNTEPSAAGNWRRIADAIRTTMSRDDGLEKTVSTTP